MNYINRMYERLSDYLTFDELVFVDALIVVGTAAAIFFPMKWVIDQILP